VSDSEQLHGITTLTLKAVIRPDTIDAPLTTQNNTVLCIDDNQDLLECEKAFLESFGYTVLTAPSGRKGLELDGRRREERWPRFYDSPWNGEEEMTC
jgi:hypothetical protein